MKYGSLKQQAVKSFRTGLLDGGIDFENKYNTEHNKIFDCNNMWYKNSTLKTRPGFKGDLNKAINTTVYGNSGELKYRITDTEIYREGEYRRIAVADVLTDDYAYYVYAYLLDLYGNIEPIGHIAFLRISNDIFYIPKNINFFSGKPQNGGGIYAMVSLENRYNRSSKNYHIYEINADFTEWQRIYNYYVPTVLINGRGNKYQTAKTEMGFNSPNPITLESLNMLDGKFYAYYTSDGFSSSFRLPFNNLASKEISCKIYYTITDYVEWVIPADNILNVKRFYNKDVSAIVDRDTGILYFTVDGVDFPVPIMDMCSENNIKITATKEIENGKASIVNASCVARYNSKLLVAGGQDGNTVYSSDYDSPLYFPKTASVDVGENNSYITFMSSQQGKVAVFKEHQLHLLSVYEGDTVNEITLLTDNDKVFKKPDSFSCEQISKDIGCRNKETVKLCAGRSFWLSEDNKVYTFDLSGKKITEVYNPLPLCLDSYNRSDVVALGSDDYYILVLDNLIVVIDISDSKKPKAFVWKTPQGLNIESAFYHSGKYMFLCFGETKKLSFIATLQGNTDSILYYDDERNIAQKDIPVSCGFTTKHYFLDGKNTKKNIDSIYFSLLSSGKVKISVNDRYKTELNFGHLNGEYDKCDYKSIRLSPHLYSVDGVTLSIESDKEMSIDEFEIRYKVLG